MVKLYYGFVLLVAGLRMIRSKMSGLVSQLSIYLRLDRLKPKR